jgi:protease-4
MKQFLLTAAGVFAGLLLFLVGVPFVLVSMALNAAGPTPLPARAVLELDLRDSLTDQSPRSPLAGLGGGGDSVMSVIETMKRAETADEVKGLLIRLPEGGLEPAVADELRLAILHFRASGKPVIAHSQGIYPSGAVTSTYMIAAAADQFWIQPGASFQVTGLANEDIFLKRFFDRYGVEADYEQRYEYKNAVNGYLYSDYTAAHRESALSWMGAVYDQAITAAAHDRKLEPAALKATLEAGPYDAADAVRLKIADHLGQVAEAEKALLDRAGSGAEMADFSDFAGGRSRARGGRGAAIAVIEGEGPIVTGRDRGGGNPFSSSSSIYSDDMAEAFEAAVKDNDIKAIVFRLNSPGGSDTASEQIGAAIRKAKAAGKPVVVSMGTYAASGGYWVAADASSIIAEPTTLTGSIGVFGGKFAIGPALARYGVDLRQLGVGSTYAGAFSTGRGFSPQERAAFAHWMDTVYGRFIQRVAEGRNLPPERVREIAKGRVWTGAQAKGLGLVDELGGFYQAVDKAKALAKLEGDPRLKRLTPGASPFQALERMLGVSASSVRTLAAAAWLFGDPRAQGLMDQLAEARMRDHGALLLSTERLQAR